MPARTPPGIVPSLILLGPAVAAQVMNAISIVQVSEQELSLEWSSSGSNDMIADSALALLSGMDSNFATAKRELDRWTPDEVLGKLIGSIARQ